MGVSPARRCEPSRNRRQEKGKRLFNKLAPRRLQPPGAVAFPSTERKREMNATATARPRQRLPRAKPARYVRLVIKPGPDSLGVVRLTVNRKSVDYLLTPLAADWGRGFKLEKIGLDFDVSTYHVNLDGDKKACECKGFLKWGHCKHADGLAALIAA